MRDENNIDVVVLGSQKAHHPEIKTPCDIFLKLTHRARHVDHRNDDRVRLVAHHLFPRLEAQIFLLDIAEARVAFARVATNVFENHPALVEICDHTRAPDLVELSLARLHRFLCFFLEIGKLKIFEDQSRKLVDVYVGFIIIHAGILSALSGTVATTRTSLASNHVADASLPVALAPVFGLLIIETKLVFVEGFDWDFDGALAVGKDDGFVGDDRAEVFADGFLYAILVAFLIDNAFALQRPVIALNRHKTPSTDYADFASQKSFTTFVNSSGYSSCGR